MWKSTKSGSSELITFWVEFDPITTDSAELGRVNYIGNWQTSLHKLVNLSATLELPGNNEPKAFVLDNPYFKGEIVCFYS